MGHKRHDNSAFLMFYRPTINCESSFSMRTILSMLHLGARFDSFGGKSSNPQPLQSGGDIEGYKGSYGRLWIIARVMVRESLQR